MKMNMPLRGLIYSKYPTESAFADDLKWSRQKLNKITTGKQIPDIADVNHMAATLGVSVNLIASFFLESKSPNGQQ